MNDNPEQAKCSGLILSVSEGAPLAVDAMRGSLSDGSPAEILAVDPMRGSLSDGSPAEVLAADPMGGSLSDGSPAEILGSLSDDSPAEILAICGSLSDSPAEILTADPIRPAEILAADPIRGSPERVNWFYVDVTTMTWTQRSAYFLEICEDPDTDIDECLSEGLEKGKKFRDEAQEAVLHAAFPFWVDEVHGSVFGVDACRSRWPTADILEAELKGNPALARGYLYLLGFYSYLFLCWTWLPPAGLIMFPDFGTQQWHCLTPPEFAYWNRHLALCDWCSRLPEEAWPLFPRGATDPAQFSEEQLEYRRENAHCMGIDECLLRYFDFWYGYYDPPDGPPVDHNTDYSRARYIETGPNPPPLKTVQKVRRRTANGQRILEPVFDEKGQPVVERIYASKKDCRGLTLGDYQRKIPGSDLELFQRLGIERVRRFGFPVIRLPNGPADSVIPDQARDRTSVKASRIVVEGGDDIKKMMSQPKPDKENMQKYPKDRPYLNFLQNYYHQAGMKRLLIGEGESDALACLFNMLETCYFGVPGTGSYKVLLLDHVKDFEELCCWEEDDDAGRRFSANLAAWLAPRPVKILRPENLPASVLKLYNVEDPCDLAAFLEKYQALNQMDAAIAYLADHPNNAVRKIQVDAKAKLDSTPNPASVDSPAEKQETAKYEKIALPAGTKKDIWYGYEVIQAECREGETWPCRYRLKKVLRDALCVDGYPHGSENMYIIVEGYCYGLVKCFCDAHNELPRYIQLSHEMTEHFYNPDLHGEPRVYHVAGALPERLCKVEDFLQDIYRDHPADLVCEHLENSYQFDLTRLPSYHPRLLQMMAAGESCNTYHTEDGQAIVEPRGLFFISGPPGCGKTELILSDEVQNMIQHRMLGHRGLFLTVRRTAVNGVQRRANALLPARWHDELRFRTSKSITRAERGGDWATLSYLIMCMESGHVLTDGNGARWLPGILILDEWTEICRNMNSDTMREQLSETLDYLQYLIACVPLIYVACADLDMRGMHMFRERLTGTKDFCYLLTLRNPLPDDYSRPALPLPPFPDDHPAVLYERSEKPWGPMPHFRRNLNQNPRAPEPRSYRLVSKEKLLENLQARLAEGLPQAMFCSLKKAANEIYLQFRERYRDAVGIEDGDEEWEEGERRIALATSMLPKNVRQLSDPQEWRQCLLALYTSVFAIGFDISLNPKHFYSFNAVISNTDRAASLVLQIQAMSRVRQLVSNTVDAYVPSRKYKQEELTEVLRQNRKILKRVDVRIRPMVAALQEEKLRTRFDVRGELVRLLLEKDEAVYDLNWPVKKKVKVAAAPKRRGRPRKTAASTRAEPIATEEPAAEVTAATAAPAAPGGPNPPGCYDGVLYCERICTKRAQDIAHRRDRGTLENWELEKLLRYRLIWELDIGEIEGTADHPAVPCTCCKTLPPAGHNPRPRLVSLSFELLDLMNKQENNLEVLAAYLRTDRKPRLVGTAGTGMILEVAMIEHLRPILERLELKLDIMAHEVIPEEIDPVGLLRCVDLAENFRKLRLPVVQADSDRLTLSKTLKKLLNKVGLATLKKPKGDGTRLVKVELWRTMLYLANEGSIIDVLQGMGALCNIQAPLPPSS